MSSSLLLTVAMAFTSAAAGSLPIATFDGAKGTTLHWETVNDPVMGGQSKSSFTVNTTEHLGVWTGEVKIVPFLHAPGFCNLQSPGLYKTAEFPDLSGSNGITLRAREALGSGLSHFNVQIMSKGARHFLKQGVYTANVTVTTEMADCFVPWSAFECSWRGEKVSWCPELRSQLQVITSVGLGTAFPGTAGPFSLEIESLSASTSTSLQDDADYIDLATFDAKATHKWHAENDPVMGGRSSSVVQIVQAYLDFKGATRIVPSLGAPGFTIALTEGFPLFSKFPDVSSMDGLKLSVRQMGSNFTGYKIAFCTSLNFYHCQFQSFKADFLVPASANGEFQDVFVPWSKFSDKWSASTGKHTAEHPPTSSDLKSIRQLQIWTEAVAGDFHLQVQYVRASKVSVTLALGETFV